MPIPFLIENPCLNWIQQTFYWFWNLYGEKSAALPENSEEAKHGMFSYFLMKGMEGEADANNDNEITAGELHSYVQTNVIQQSSGSQTPELQGDADRVLVHFQ